MRGPNDPDRRKFWKQRSQAKQRGVPFLLTFEEWLAWWEAFSPNWRELRGRHRGQYCMSRFGDVGPYALGNIEAKLHEKNCGEAVLGRHWTVPPEKVVRGERNGQAKLTADLVRQIRADDRLYREIVKAFGVALSQVSMIKQRKIWAHVD